MPAGDVEVAPNAAEPLARPVSVSEDLPPLPAVATAPGATNGELQSSLPSKTELPKDQLDAANALITRYEQEAKAMGREPKAAPLYLETGRLWEEALGKQRNAAMCYQRAFQLSPKDPNILHASRRLFSEVGNWQMVGQILRAQLDAELDMVRRARLSSELGLLLEHRLSSAKDAEKLYTDALSASPLEAVALDGLERIYMERRDFAALHGLVVSTASATPSRPDRIRLLGRAADIADLFLDDPQRAAEHWQAVLELDGSSVVALESLRRLYASASQWEALTGVLERAADISPRPRAAALLAAAARIQNERLHAPDKAILAFLRAFELDPNNAGLLREMEALYAENEKWNDVAKVLRAELDLVPQAERARELMRLGRILEERLGDLAGSIAAYEEAIVLAPNDPVAPARLERALASAGRWKELAERVDATLASLEPDAKIQRLLELADLRDLRLDDLDGAASALERLLELSPTDRHALSWLGRIEQSRGRWAAVLSILDRRVALEDRVDAQIELLLRAAVVAEDHLSDLEGAERYLRRALELRPDDRPAVMELVRILERRGAHAAAYEAYGTLEALSSGEELARIAHRRGQLAEQRIADVEGAIGCYGRALAAKPGYRAALDSLGRILRSTGRWTDLLALLERSRDMSTSLTDRRFAEEEIARISEERLNDPATAIAAHEAILATTPQSATARAALSRLYVLTENGERLADLWAESATHEADPVARSRAACRAAEIFESLGNAERAVDLYRFAFDSTQGEESAFGLTTLQAAAGEWNALSELLLRIAEAETDPERKASVHVRVAQVALAKRSQPDEAVAALSAALAAQPGYASALDWLVDVQAVRADVEAWLAALGERSSARSDPDQAAAYHLRCATHAAVTPEAGDPAPHLLAALEAVPSHPAALAELEITYRRARHYEGLLALYQRRAALETAPLALAGFAFRAAEIAETRLGQLDVAATYYDKALRADPTHLPALRGARRAAAARGDGDAALDSLERELALTTDPKRIADLAFEAGVLHQDKRADLTKAIEAFESVLEKVPDHADAFARLRAIHEQRADFPALIALLEKRAQLTSGSERAGLMMAIATIEEDQILEPATAEARYREVLAVDPDNRAALARLGRILFDAKRYGDARSVLERSAQLYAGIAEPSSDEVLELARIYRELGFIFLEHDRDLVRCVECLQAAIQLDRTDTESLVRLADVYEGAGDWTSAINVLLRLADVQRNNPERVKTLVELGRIYAQKVDDIENGILAHRKALELDATNRDAILGLVELYEKSGRWGELARDASGYLQAFPPENRTPAIPLHLRLARIYESKLDDTKRAVEELGRALEVDPNHADALAELARIHAKSESTLPEALKIHRRLLVLDPFRVESLHAMRQIFASRKEHDRAFVLSELLVFLRAPTQEEEVYFQEYKDRVPPVGSGELSRDEHEDLVTHPDERGVVRYVLESIAPEVGKVFAGNLGRFDVNPKDKQKPELAIKRRADEIAQVLGAPPFDLYLTKKQGMDLGIFVEYTDPPSLVVGDNVPRRMREVESNFLLGRELERMKGAHYLFQTVPAAEIELMIYASLKLARADYPAPKEGPALDEMIRRLTRVLSKKARKSLDALANVGTVRLDFAKHTSAAAMTANRAGLVVTNSIETCIRAIAKQNKLKAVFTNPNEARDAIGQHAEIRDLLCYAVSEEYLKARAQLGFAVDIA
ncbi:MAG: tetratricopeptide repeat protein [Deltaproteobacteria bacterium]|nr:tetratricopeptide repeat protein [Deltaproteobacteria bacterium]